VSTNTILPNKPRFRRRNPPLEGQELRDRLLKANIPVRYLQGDWSGVDSAKDIQTFLTEDYWKSNKQRGMFIHGNKGVGKSQLLGLIAKYFVSNYFLSLIYTSAIDLSEKLFSREIQAKLDIENMRMANILLIDDVMKEYESDFATAKFLSIIESRYSTVQPIFMTSNFPIDSVESRNGYEVIADRLRDRDWMTELFMAGESKRGAVK